MTTTTDYAPWWFTIRARGGFDDLNCRVDCEWCGQDCGFNRYCIRERRNDLAAVFHIVVTCVDAVGERIADDWAPICHDCSRLAGADRLWQIAEALSSLELVREDFSADGDRRGPSTSPASWASNSPGSGRSAGGPVTDTQLTLDDAAERADYVDGSRFVSTEDMRTIKMWNRDPSAPPRYEYDKRGTPIGPRAQVWEFERMMLPRGHNRRVRQRVKVMHCPQGWYGRSGSLGRDGAVTPEICYTIWDCQDRHEFNAFHAVNPVLWVVKISQPGADSKMCWCDVHLPAEYRPQADGSPPAEFGPLAGQEPARKPKREKPKDPARYAVPDPLDPAKVSYWYRPDKGGQLRPWPPQRNTWGKLYYKDMPGGYANRRSQDSRAYADAHWAKVRDARRAAVAEIEANLEVAAARFARYSARCCCCGKAMWDDRSVTYGIGPECRRYAAPEFLSQMLEVMKRALAEDELGKPEGDAE